MPHGTMKDCLSSALEDMQSHADVHAEAPLRLTEEDWAVFLSACENPPWPNERLRRAFALHKVHVKQVE